MPIAVLVVGALLLVTVWRGNTTEVFSQIETDVVGSDGQAGFALWAGAILFLAAAGAILNLEKTAKLFIMLVLAVFAIKQNGLFTKAESALASVAKPAATTTTDTGQAVTALDQPAVGSGSATTATSSSSGTSAATTALAAGMTTGASMLSSALKGIAS